MTTSENDPPSRPISVAELLAKNGSIGAPPPATGRRRRRRGDTDSISVAELTGEIPLVNDDTDDPRTGGQAVGTDSDDTTGAVPTANGAALRGEVRPDSARQPRSPEPWRATRAGEATGNGTAERERAPHAFEPTPVRRSAEQARAPHAFDPRPASRTAPPRAVPPEDDELDTDASPSLYVSDIDDVRTTYGDGAEGMSFDPVVEADPDVDDIVDDLADIDEVGSEDAEPHFMRGGQDTLFGGRSFADDVARGHQLDDATMDPEIDFDEQDAQEARGTTLLHYGLIVGQSILAVVFGAGMFLAFDQLWEWNPIVALVLSVLVVLGLVVGVRVVRKTEDIASTLIAVAVGLLVCLGPLALLG